MNMKKAFAWSLALLMMASVSFADTTVLIHGYLSGAQTWHNAGIAQILSRNGWSFAGTVTPQAVLATQAADSKNRFYTVDLPSDAPIQLQADLLANILTTITKIHPDDKQILVGHSAGGLVARTVLVRGQAPQAKSLITIATPHLGTGMAGEALDSTDSPWPISMIEEFFVGDIYDTVRNSRGVLIDLLPQNNSAFLSWLNSRQHPDIRYVSIIRQNYDGVVPPFSQDMNRVAPIEGKSALVLTTGGHGLTPMDGEIILEQLNK